MSETIAQRDLRNDNAEIMRRVEAGESFVITRNGRPIADLAPHATASKQARRKTLGELQTDRRRGGPLVDSAKWLADRAGDDPVFGDDSVEY